MTSKGQQESSTSLANDRRIHLRVGVHVGEVVESEGDISGDAVNVASRIEPLAKSSQSTSFGEKSLIHG